MSLRARMHPLRRMRKRFVRASWYGPRFFRRLRADGTPYGEHDMFVANRRLPFGTMGDITYPKTGRHSRVPVRDRGPYVDGREFDLSFAAAHALGIYQREVVTVAYSIVPDHP